MAFLGELKVSLLIDEAGLSKSVSASMAQLNSIQSGISGISEAASQISLQGLESKFNAVGKAGVAAFSDIARTGEDFQTALLKVNTIAGLSDNELQALGESVKTIGENTGLAVSPTQALASEYEVLSSGFTKTADASKVLESSLRLSAAGNAEAKDTTRLLTAVLNAYGETAEDAAKRSDQLFQTVNIGVTTVPELSQSLGRVLTVASTAGVSFEELSAAIAVATQRGQTTSAAIDGLSGVLNSFIKPTKEAQKEMAALGLTINETTLREKGLAATLEEVNIASNGNVESLGRIVGTHAAIATSSSLLRDKGVGLRQSIDQITNSAGSNKKAVDELSKGSEEAGKKMAVAFENLKISAAETFLPLKKDATEALTAIIQVVEKTPSALKIAALAFAALGTAITVSGAALIGFRLAVIPLRAELTLLGATIIPRLTAAYALLNIPLGTAIKLFVSKALVLARTNGLAAIAAVRNFTLAGSFSALTAGISPAIAALFTFNGVVGIAAAGLGAIAAAGLIAIKMYTDLYNEVSKANQALIDSDNLQKKGRKTQGNISISTSKILNTDVKTLAAEGLTKDTVTQRILDEQRGTTQLRNEGASDKQIQDSINRANKLRQIRIDLEKELNAIANNKAGSVAEKTSGVTTSISKSEEKDAIKAQKEEDRARKRKEREDLRVAKAAQRELDRANKAEERELKKQQRLEEKAAKDAERLLKREEKEKDRIRKREEKEKERARKKEEKATDRQTKLEAKKSKDKFSELQKEAKKAERDKLGKDKKDTKDTAKKDEKDKSAFDFEQGSSRLRSNEFSGQVMSVEEFAKQSNEDFGNNPFKRRLTDKEKDIVSNANDPLANPRSTPAGSAASEIAKLAKSAAFKSVTVPVNINLNGKNAVSKTVTGDEGKLKQDSTIFNTDFILGEA